MPGSPGNPDFDNLVECTGSRSSSDELELSSPDALCSALMSELSAR